MTGLESPSDPDLDAFFDSLVWEEWEPGSPTCKDPPTLLQPVEVMDPSHLETPPLTGQRGFDRDPGLQSLIDAWPTLSKSARNQILAYACHPIRSNLRDFEWFATSISSSKQLKTWDQELWSSLQPRR
jgi:hypothetical protein